METLTVSEEFLKPWIYAILFKTVRTSTLTGLSGRMHLWVQSWILSQPKKSKEKTPLPWITKINERKLMSYWPSTTEVSPRLLYVKAVRLTSALSCLNAFGPSLPPSEVHSLSAPLTSPHPTLNELDIPVEMVLTTLKQLEINKGPAEGNRWPGSHHPWPCYSTNLCGLAFFQKTGNSRI